MCIFRLSAKGSVGVYTLCNWIGIARGGREVCLDRSNGINFCMKTRVILLCSLECLCILSGCRNKDVVGHLVEDQVM